MITAQYDLSISKGADYEEFFNLKDGNNQPLNLDGYSARMQIRPYLSSDIVLIDATTENGIISINGPLGRIKINLSETQTSNLIYTESVYDLLITSPSGFTNKVLQGKVIVSLNVTRN